MVGWKSAKVFRFVNSTASRLLGFEHPSNQHRYSYSSEAKAQRATKVG